MPMPPFGSKGTRDALTATVQTHTGEHSEFQYQGMLKGLGVSSKEPVCNKRNTRLKRVMDATHFAVGCNKWDEGGRNCSVAHETFTDPEVVYMTRDAPDKNASVIDLRQRAHDPDVHYRTEQRDRFLHDGPQPRVQPFNYNDLTQVHLGDDQPELVTQTHVAHFRSPDDEALRAASLRAAGAGTLIPTSLFPKPERCHPVHAGPRTLDAHDLGIANNMRWNKITANQSAIVMDHNIRNPIMGHHIPAAHYGAPRGAVGMKTTNEIIAEANSCVPHLRSMGALRPSER